MTKRSPVAVTSAAQPKRSRAATSPIATASSSRGETTATTTTTTTMSGADLEADSRCEWHEACHDDQSDQQRLQHRQLQQHDAPDDDELAVRKTFKQQQQQQSLHVMATAAASAASDGIASSSRRSRAPSTHANSADQHSCLAAPYSPSDARTLRYFDVVISKANAPVVCASAGKLKGKAIFADKAIEQAARIWTEAPLVAMQHESNRAHVRCCQYCFVPLLADYRTQWRAIAARWNASSSRSASDPPVGDDELDRALQQLQVHRRNCGLADPGAVCCCGEVYCSRLCQLRAFHEYHAILCPRADAYSAMSQFLAHMRHTNDIFFLVAKVVARLLSRYVHARDVLKAREPMDMFYKKPWWEVVMLEKQLQTTLHDSSSGDSSGSAPRDDGVDAIARAFSEHAARNAGPDLGLGAHLDEMRHASDDDGLQAQCLRELLTYTHQLLLDAIECNLVHLAREDQLQGLGVDDLWTACASILSFEFFAAQLGLFEMNNVSMEIDHPFRSLIEILDPDVHAEPSDGDTTTTSGARPADDSVVTRVRRVLEHEEARLVAQQQQATTRSSPRSDDKGDRADSTAAALGSPFNGGFRGVEGTALFPIICTMNHSCEPNCTVLYTKDGHAHVVAVRDIAKGDELCICYIDIDDDVRTREANLREYQFKCYCARCSAERRALALSPTATSAALGGGAVSDTRRPPSHTR